MTLKPTVPGDLLVTVVPALRRRLEWVIVMSAAGWRRSAAVIHRDRSRTRPAGGRSQPAGRSMGRPLPPDPPPRQPVAERDDDRDDSAGDIPSRGRGLDHCDTCNHPPDRPRPANERQCGDAAGDPAGGIGRPVPGPRKPSDQHIPAGCRYPLQGSRVRQRRAGRHKVLRNHQGTRAGHHNLPQSTRSYQHGTSGR